MKTKTRKKRTRSMEEVSSSTFYNTILPTQTQLQTSSSPSLKATAMMKKVQGDLSTTPV